MSGHSKWSTIKRKKGALDAKRGKIFSRLAKEITVAAKLGGGDPAGNPRLRTVLLAAKAENMPKDNIERAIKKGTGEIEGVTYEEMRYECYGPSGVAVIVDTLTDNKNRTVGEVRHILNRHNGSMAASGSVVWNFDAKGSIILDREGLDEEEILEKAVEAGAEDVDMDAEDVFEIITEATQLHAVAGALEDMGLNPKEPKLKMVPRTTVEVTGKELSQVLRLLDLLEENDDVQDVYSNVDFNDDAIEAAMAE